MTQERLKRLSRLLKAREELVAQREVAVSKATLALQAATEAVDRVTLALRRAADRSESDAPTLADVADARLFVTALGRSLESASQVASAAQEERDACMRGLRDARAEVRKVEQWRDRIVESTASEERRAERLAMDEIAAKAHRTG